MSIEARSVTRGQNEALEFSGGYGINFGPGPSNRRGAPIDSGDRSLAPYNDRSGDGKAEQRVTDRYRRLLREGETTAARAVLATAYDLGYDLDSEVSRSAEGRPGASRGVQMSRQENAAEAARKHDADYAAYKRQLGLTDETEAERRGFGSA